MMPQLYLGVLILAVFATAVANPEINVVCEKDSVRITWRISAELVPHAARLFLGNCMPSRLNVLPSGEGEAHFNYKFADCKFKRGMNGKHLLYQNELTYRPHAKSKPAAVVYPIECVYKRPEGWIPPFLNPGSGVSEGRGGLVFHMALLNEQLTGVAKTNVIPLGSFIPIWAAVEQRSHQPLLLLMEECVAAMTPQLWPDSQVYPIISNKGCLLESMRGNSVFLPRYHSSALILYLQSFKFGLGEEVYIHCKLVAWDPEVLDESKKACHYVKENGRWELLDDPFQSSICSCCDSTCHSRSKRWADWGSHGFSHKSVLGPLIIMDPSDSQAQGIPQVSDSQQESPV
ncbi:zona pellucida glycoprotein 3f, tandem duplicate 2 isoform X1 [Acanthopagrus latus]|uniref:zona pellucida glycoprotein 3f, tandem duplicate 2 isoform X1 n=1 Tax=Acanthopagrus latus TaxID=8177 RepID=UPI00187CC18A|nr:zona pellucida glycoprotein 3f, tandem duplicate 2 isoform X1 [Acanthopagrus latus]